ncbi:hypothetical protein Tco_0994362 [Tanacetum coccineum]
METRPIFSNVEDMLQWAGLYDLTTKTLEDELVGLKFSPMLIQELITNLYELRKLLLAHLNDMDTKYLLVSVEKLAVTGYFEDLLRKLFGVGSEEADHDMCVGCRCVNSRW